MLKKILSASITALLGVMIAVSPVKAAESKSVDITVTSSTGSNTAALVDDRYSTSYDLVAGETITVKSATPFQGLYIEWYVEPSAWKLNAAGKAYDCGQYGFRHEWVQLQGNATEATLTMPTANSMCNIYAYSEGTLPSTVQVWKPRCEKADFLVVSTHADDEILFLGGVLAEYAGERELAVQVAYFSNYDTSEIIREHEKLDGLWAIGVRNYPENADFGDTYSDDLQAAINKYGYEETMAWVTSMIRKYKPLVLVTQDKDGEYGHGTHMLVSKAVLDSANVSNDPSKYPESAQKYGAYDVPKTYIHLWPENKIKLDCRKALTKFGGQNAVDVASAAYKWHVSQQYCWFYVSDTYEYSIAEFGLARTTVGPDKNGNEMLENVVTYEAQAKAEAEQKAKEEESRKAEQQQTANNSSDSKGGDNNDASEDNESTFGKVIKVIVIVAVVILVVLFVASFAYVTYVKQQQKKRRRRRRRSQNIKRR